MHEKFRSDPEFARLHYFSSPSRRMPYLAVFTRICMIILVIHTLATPRQPREVATADSLVCSEHTIHAAWI